VASKLGANAIGYRHLLGTILLSFLIIIAVPTQYVSAPLRVAVVAALLQMTLRLRRRPGRLARPAWILSGTLFVTTVVAAVVAPGKVLAAISQASMILLVLGAVTVLASTLRESKIVDTSVVRGVLSVYLLLALLFAAVNELGATVTSHYVDGVTMATPSNMLYFSIITITTVGYGDISPGNGVAQAVAATEALVGQLYLVSVVAVVISRFRSQANRGD
jgi:hypothetical protein